MKDEKKTHFLKLMPHNIKKLKNVRKKYADIYSAPFTDNEIVNLGCAEFERQNTARLKLLKTKEIEKGGLKKDE